jgi:hypothetical protein
VTVGTGATLNIGGDVAIGGNIQATQCLSVVIISFENGRFGPVLVGGNVTIQQCTAPSGVANTFFEGFGFAVLIHGNFTCSNNSAGCDVNGGSVGGNVTIANNSGPDLFFGGASAVFLSSIGGNVQFNNNSGPAASVVELNTIGGNLQCQGNSSVINNGFPNQVVGNEQGQCSGL